MLKLIALFILFVSIPLTEGVIPQRGSSFYQIVKNNPDVDEAYALELSLVIDRVAGAFKIPPQRLAAILAQESMYRLDAVNHKSRDYGIAQINHATIKRFGFDKELLLTDLEYSVKAGAIVLADFKRMYGKRDKNYWTRYNSSNPDKRQEYKILVARFM